MSENDETVELVALRRCAHCGAMQANDSHDLEGVWLEKNDHDDPEYYVKCWKCGAQTKGFSTPDNAIAAWNARAAIAAMPERGEQEAREWRTDVLPFDQRPCRQFILVEGWKEHSGRLWNRVWADTAWIRRDDQPDSQHGYRKEDMDRICRDGGMDGIDRVLGWLPATFPAFDALPTPPESAS